MVRMLKGFAVTVGVLLLLVIGVYLTSRAMGPSKVEREALTLIDTPPVHQGSDGFAALYTLTRDIPDDKQGSVLAEDVRRVAALPLPSAEGTGAPLWHSALEDWPTLGENRNDDPAWCSLHKPGCLELVRSAPQAYAGLLERNATQLDRVEALSAWDHFANPFPPRLDTPLPAYQPWTRLITRDAWRFANGEIDAGLAGACAGVAQGRKLIAAGDSLIGSMIGVALVQGNATLLADMLAELPRDHALPPSCGAAFDLPMPLDDGVCRTMLSEARYTTGVLRTQIVADVEGGFTGKKVPAWTSRLLFDPERTVARGAPKFAWYCGGQARALLAQDQPLLDRSAPSTRWSLQCVSNPVGCMLTDIAEPAYSDYALRLQDALARLRTTAALLWLREQPGALDKAAFARLPASMQSTARPLQLDASTGTLATALYEKPGKGKDHESHAWAIPLPASWLQSAEAASP